VRGHLTPPQDARGRAFFKPEIPGLSLNVFARRNCLCLCNVQYRLVGIGEHNVHHVSMRLVVVQDGDVLELVGSAGPIRIDLNMDVLAVGVVDQLDKVADIFAVGGRVEARSTEEGLVEGRTEINGIEMREVEYILLATRHKFVIGDGGRRERIGGVERESVIADTACQRFVSGLTGKEAVAAIKRIVPRAAKVGNLDVVAVELDMNGAAGKIEIRDV
jgi:hypothetical protein